MSCSASHNATVSDLFSSLSPQSLLTGMNKFLASLEITFRRDPTNYRPRVNKKYSVKDREQKGACRLLSHLFMQMS